MLVMVRTGSPRWFSAVQCRRTIPRSGFDVDGRCSCTVTVARSVSPGRTGRSQRSSSTPGEPRLHAASALMGVLTGAAIVTQFVFGIPSIIAVVMNYVRRGEAVPPELILERDRELLVLAGSLLPRIPFDPLDVPRDRFVVAGNAWRLCRRGKADPQAFGILDMHGLWFIAGNVIRDIAALNNHEMLPWDVWGAMARTDAELDLPLFDHLAELSHVPDEHAGELSAAYEDKRIAVPGTVFNAVLNRPDPVH